MLEEMIIFTSFSFLIEKHLNDYDMIFAGICTEQICFLKFVEFDV